MIVSMDKKYTNSFKNTIEILCIDANGQWPVITKTNGQCQVYTIEGLFTNKAKSEYNLIEVGEYDHIKLGDPCLFWNNNSFMPKRGYFAGINKNSNPIMYDDGATAWSSLDSRVTRWDHCKLADIDNE